ncbi:hypothetical protein GALL_480090 [mine drainage metagenome]|uniref:Uncharacterized protein n=1 Tax=mine drainage metagenome TaxID=410659 RepID=A0A1J5PS18_9ZZZZ
MGGDLFADLGKSRRAEVNPVHLVDDNRDLFDAEKMQQIAVAPGLVAHAFQRVDDQERAVRLRGAGDHVAQEFGVSRRVDQHHVARLGAETDLRGVDGDALVALGLQRVEQERPFEWHAPPRADGFEHFEFAFRQAACLMQETSDQCRLAVIDMTDDDDAHLRARGAVWRCRQRGGDGYVHCCAQPIISVRDSRRHAAARKHLRFRDPARVPRAPAPWCGRAQ